MSVNEKMVQDIVQEVVAKMQISSDVAGKKGVFSEDCCQNVHGPERGDHFQHQTENQRKC